MLLYNDAPLYCIHCPAFDLTNSACLFLKLQKINTFQLPYIFTTPYANKKVVHFVRFVHNSFHGVCAGREGHRLSVHCHEFYFVLF